MLNKLGKQITDVIIQKGYIEEDERELYEYGFFIVSSKIVYLLITSVFGLILNVWMESLIFFIAFDLIRKYAGGFHAATELRCTMITTGAIFLSLCLIKASYTYNLHLLLFILSLCFSLVIFLFAPMDTPEKPLSGTEKKRFRQRTWLYLALITVSILIAYITAANFLFSPCCMAVILEGILLLAGKIKTFTSKTS